MATNIIVGDIGSTKSSWRSNYGNSQAVSLGGYHPIMQSPEIVTRMLEQLSAAFPPAADLALWYYGAGVIDQKTKSEVKETIHRYYPNAAIEVHSDLLGACRAACGKESGMVAILGTGSHVALYDGKEITQQAQSLGYILGDEGSGCDIGKKLVRAYYYQQMPEEIATDMRATLPDERGAFLRQLQDSAVPNQMLAGFASIAVSHQDHPWIRQMVQAGMREYITNHVLPLHPGSKMYVIGSIGYIFASLFISEMEKLRSDVVARDIEFIRDPVDRLFDFHLKENIL